MRTTLHIFALIGAMIGGAGGVACAQKNGGVPIVQFLDYYEVPGSTRADNGLFGGASGLDYDATTGLFYVISDARGEGDEGAARYFSMRLGLDGEEIIHAAIERADYFLNPDGAPFEQATTDFEAIRQAPGGFSVFVSSERDATGVPSVFEFDFDGSFVRELRPPDYFEPGASRGARDNRGFEAVAITPDGLKLFTALEDSLEQDGPSWTKGESAYCRVLEYDISDDEAFLSGQFTYQTDQSSGLVELIALGGDRFLSLERSYTGIKADGAKIFLVDKSGADSIGDEFALSTAATTPAAKTLLYDLREQGRTLFNVEGMALGPILPSGAQSLVLISDNNFDGETPTQIFLFAINGVAAEASRGAPFWLLILIPLPFAALGGWLIWSRRRIEA